MRRFQKVYTVGPITRVSGLRFAQQTDREPQASPAGIPLLQRRTNLLSPIGLRAEGSSSMIFPEFDEHSVELHF